MRNFLPCSQFMMQRLYQTAKNGYTLALHLIISLLGQVLFSALATQPHICTTILGTFPDVTIKTCFRHKEVVKRLLDSVAFIKDDHVKVTHYQFQKGFSLLTYSRCSKSRNCCNNNRGSIAVTEHLCTQALIKIGTKMIFVSLF